MLSWPELKVALIEHFRSMESDEELTRKMDDRHQGPNETFDQFYSDLLKLNSRLRTPKGPERLIFLIRQNVRSDIGGRLLTYKTDSLPEMVYTCRNIEKYSYSHFPRSRQQNPQFQSHFPKRVHEMEYQDPATRYTESVEAVVLSNASTGPGAVVCWNCKVSGHIYHQCPSPQRTLFCYKCGLPNTTTPHCPKCSENRQRSNLVTRENCSSTKSPELKQ